MAKNTITRPHHHHRRTDAVAANIQKHLVLAPDDVEHVLRFSPVGMGNGAR
jgi:hypothetical protein